MKRIRTVEAAAHSGETVRVQGWLHNLRRMGGVTFVILRDGWGTIQAVTENEQDLAPLAQAGLESVIYIEGVIVSREQAPSGVEMHRPQITLVTAITEQPPCHYTSGQSKRACRFNWIMRWWLTDILSARLFSNWRPKRWPLFAKR